MIATPSQRAAALEVWSAANCARGNPPSGSRIARVQTKLASADALLVVGIERDDVVAMALAEPARDRSGAGEIRQRAGHISMVFVDPARWGRGVGGALLDALHLEMQARDWSHLSLWTRSTNARARRLYERRGYRLASEVKQLADGDEIVRYELDIETQPPALAR